MLTTLFRKLRAPEFRPKIPPGLRVYAIGDIHGCDTLLAELLDRIAEDDTGRPAARTILVFLGDLIDRGPQSAEVVERLLRLKADRADVRFLTGNHEEILLRALDNDEKALRLFDRVGGRETALSYGIPAAAYMEAEFPVLAGLLSGHVPPSHRAFLEAFEEIIVLGDYAFVHAGVAPGVALDQQRVEDLRWIREPFLRDQAPLAKMIVHGHTISEEVEFRTHRIGIDTGAYRSGRLTALGLEGDQRWKLQTDPNDSTPLRR